MAKIHLQICFFFTLSRKVLLTWSKEFVGKAAKAIHSRLSINLVYSKYLLYIMWQESISNKAQFTEETNILFLEGRVHCAQRPATYI